MSEHDWHRPMENNKYCGVQTASLPPKYQWTCSKCGDVVYRNCADGKPPVDGCTADSKELLPCPFCGGEAVFHDSLRPPETYPCRVYCDNCRAEVDGYSTEAEAIAAWNARAERTCEIEVRDSAWGGFTRYCGNCGADLDCDTRNKQNYCPSCGARVIGGNG